MIKNLIIITIILFTSCNNSERTEPELPKEEYKVKTRIDYRSTYDLVTVEHDRHELILWLNGYGSQMMHKPNCYYCKLEKDTL